MRTSGDVCLLPTNLGSELSPWALGGKLAIGLGFLPLQAVAWAKKTKRGAPIESKCQECVTLAHAYPSLSWEALCAKSGTNELFRAELAGARKILRGKPQTFYPQSVQEERDASTSAC